MNTNAMTNKTPKADTLVRQLPVEQVLLDSLWSADFQETDPPVGRKCPIFP